MQWKNMESQARQQALEKLGISTVFRRNSITPTKQKFTTMLIVKAPIETVNASIAPPQITIEKLYACSISPSETMNPGPATY
jgi:hypothetical protein